MAETNYGSSGPTYDATTGSAVSFVSDTPLHTSESNTGQCADFPGTTNTTNQIIATTGSGTILTSQTKGTFITWAKQLDTSVNYDSVVNDYSNPNGWASHAFYGVDTTGNVYFDFNSSVWIIHGGSGAYLSNGTWRMLAMVIDTTQAVQADRFKVYISTDSDTLSLAGYSGGGTISQNSTFTSNDASIRYPCVGQTVWLQSRAWKGRMASYSVWGGQAISSTDLQTLYEKAKRLNSQSGYYSAIESGFGSYSPANLHWRMEGAASTNITGVSVGSDTTASIIDRASDQALYSRTVGSHTMNTAFEAISTSTSTTLTVGSSTKAGIIKQWVS